MFMPVIPGFVSSSTMNAQSRCFSCPLYEGIDLIRLRRMPCIPLGSLGEKNVAMAEWKTEILLLIGRISSGLVPICSATHMSVMQAKFGSSMVSPRLSISHGYPCTSPNKNPLHLSQKINWHTLSLSQGDVSKHVVAFNWPSIVFIATLIFRGHLHRVEKLWDLSSGSMSTW